MMNARENLLSLFRREGFDFVPPEFSLCPSLVARYVRETGSDAPYEDYFSLPWRNVQDIHLTAAADTVQFRAWYQKPLAEDTEINAWGMGFERGSAAAAHMRHMRHPLQGHEDLDTIRAYPFPRFARGATAAQREQVAAIHARGLAATGNMQCTIWETAWYLRSMEDLMMDMADDSPIATFLLDIVLEQAVARAEAYAHAGVDILYLGDDVGTQRGPLMSLALYRQWIWPRLKTVIDAAKAIRPDLLVAYHSCGAATAFIPDLIAAGIDILNPLQSECMDFREVVAAYGDRLSFHGCLGTQTVFPFGTPEEVRAATFACLDACGPKGGMLAAPTHLLEPEVPWENVLAYVQACADYTAR